MNSRPTATIDHCCLIALEKRESGAYYVEALVDAWRYGRIDLAVCTIGATENTIDHRPVAIYEEHEQRLKDLGLERVGKIYPVVYVGLTYLGQSKLADCEMVAEEKRIREILHPGFEWEPPKEKHKNGNRTPEYKKWVNRFCDVNLVLAHAHARREVLVTSDEKLLKKKVALQNVIDVGEIMRPYEFLQMLG